MGIFSKVGRGAKWFLKPVVDVPTWMGARQIKFLTAGLVDQLKGVFTVAQKARNPETFEQAKQRLGLTDEMLQAKQKDFLKLALFFLLVGIAILFYGMYFFWQGHLRGGILAFVLALLAFTNTFRNHFWAFQIKHKKLGCTVREWWQSAVEEP